MDELDLTGKRIALYMIERARLPKRANPSTILA